MEEQWIGGRRIHDQRPAWPATLHALVERIASAWRTLIGLDSSDCHEPLIADIENRFAGRVRSQCCRDQVDPWRQSTCKGAVELQTATRPSIETSPRRNVETQVCLMLDHGRRLLKADQSQFVTTQDDNPGNTVVFRIDGERQDLIVKRQCEPYTRRFRNGFGYAPLRALAARGLLLWV